MAPKNENIYESKARPKAGGRVVQIAPTRARARTRRAMIWTFSLMIGLLAAAVYFISENEKKGERPDLKEVSGARVGPEMRKAWQRPSIAERSVDPEPLIDFDRVMQGDAETRTARRERDPELLAQANEYVRICHDYIRAEEWADAEKYARKALLVWPEMNAAQRLLGAVFTQRGQFDQAITVLNQSLETDPFSAEAYSNLAAAYMHKGNMEKAEQYLDTALKIRPDFLVAQLNLGLLYLAAGRYAKAAQELEKSVEIVPDNLSARNNLAVALLRTGRYEDAREQLRELLERQPDYIHAFFNMAITYTLEGDFEQAIDWVRQGSEHCSPVVFQQFVSDADLRELHDLPDFLALMQSIFGPLPEFKQNQIQPGIDG